jgi:hypothetical protein
MDHMPRPISQLRATMSIIALMPWLETAAPVYETRKMASIKMTSRHETICMKSTAIRTARNTGPHGSSTSSGRGVSKGVSSLASGVVDSRGRDLGLGTMLRFSGGGRVPLRMLSSSGLRNEEEEEEDVELKPADEGLDDVVNVE